MNGLLRIPIALFALCAAGCCDNFAADGTPDGEVSLCGILLCGSISGTGDRFIVKPRSRNDCTIHHTAD